MKSSSFNWTIAPAGSMHELYVGFQWSVRNRLCKACMPLQLQPSGSVCFCLMACNNSSHWEGKDMSFTALLSRVDGVSTRIQSTEPCPAAHCHFPQDIQKPNLLQALGITEPEIYTRGLETNIHQLFTQMYFKLPIRKQVKKSFSFYLVTLQRNHKSSAGWYGGKFDILFKVFSQVF